MTRCELGRYKFDGNIVDRQAKPALQMLVIVEITENNLYGVCRN